MRNIEPTGPGRKVKIRPKSTFRNNSFRVGGLTRRDKNFEKIMDYLLFPDLEVKVDSLIDDIWFVRKSQSEGEKMLKIIVNLCAEIGVELKPKKIFPPKQIMKVLGLTYDLENRRISLNKKKRQKLVRNIDEFLSLNSCAILNVQKILGRIPYHSSSEVFILKVCDFPLDWYFKPMC